MELEELKKKLRSYKENELEFYEPHFTNQMLARGGNKQEIVNCLLNPEKLVYFKVSEGKYGDQKYCLLFKVSNTRTMMMPVIFDRNRRKGLYIITYVMKYRPWENIARAMERRK